MQIYILYFNCTLGNTLFITYLGKILLQLQILLVHIFKFRSQLHLSK